MSDHHNGFNPLLLTVEVLKRRLCRKFSHFVLKFLLDVIFCLQNFFDRKHFQGDSLNIDNFLHKLNIVAVILKDHFTLDVCCRWYDVISR